MMDQKPPAAGQPSPGAVSHSAELAEESCSQAGREGGKSLEYPGLHQALVVCAGQGLASWPMTKAFHDPFLGGTHSTGSESLLFLVHWRGHGLQGSFFGALRGNP